MSDNTGIDYLDATWSPVTGCSPVSAGCAHCWAKGMAHRMWGERPFSDVRCHEDRLTIPLHWRKPRRIGVCFMGDLFHEAVPQRFIAEVFGVAAVAGHVFYGPGGIGMRVGTRYDKGMTNPRPIRAMGTKFGPHEFLLLTKRAERMRSVLVDLKFRREVADAAYRFAHDRVCAGGLHDDIESGLRWPLPNVWLGVSVEDQATADARIPLLLQTPAAVRYVSAEPLLGPLDLTPHLQHETCVPCCGIGGCEYCDGTGTAARQDLNFVIVGGESGPGARPCDVAWIRRIVQDCKAAGTNCYVKQLGSNVRDRNDAGFEGDKPGGWPMDTKHEAHGGQEFQGDPVRVLLKARKGNDPSEWPEDLRVRELPR